MKELISALRAAEQADMDSCMVKVSRQACAEAADALELMQKAERRYEIVRRLNVKQFADLFNKSIVCGIPFDTLVDDLAAQGVRHE